MKTKKTVHITLGSLFDGIGGFPYAASFYGIKTLWASEIVPAAISVTRRHFPDIEHVGDITKLKGGELTPVDIITFGSPCQSFSIAGKRTGLEGKSGLFWEAIRIIKEMREATNGQYPRYSVLENVPGILSANNGRDYQAVLEAFTETKIPFPPSGRWTNAGMVRGGRIDVAWIIHDAQHFGVAQRRRRLFAVCDFTGQRAAEILFKPKSLHRYFAEGCTTGKRITSDAQGSIGSASRAACEKDIASTLVAGYGNHWNGNAGAYDGGNFALTENCEANNGNDDEYYLGFDGYNSNLTGCIASTLGVNCGMPTGRNGVLEAGAFMGGQSAGARSIAYNEKVTPTLKSSAGGNTIPCVCEPKSAVTVINDQGGDSLTIEKKSISPTLRSETHGNLPIISIYSKEDSSIYPNSENFEKNVESVGFISKQGDKTANIGYKDELFLTITANQEVDIVVGVHQNADGTIKISEKAYTLTTSSGASARNAPLICEKICVFSLDSAESNSMKSKNPYSGCRKTETARTLDTTNPCPSKNQGGIAIVCVHPEIAGTLVASGAGLSRTAGMGSETDLCIVQVNQEDLLAYGFDLQQITSKTNRSQLKDIQPVLCKSGQPHVVISDNDTKNDPNPDVCGTLCAKSIAPNGIGNETDMCILQHPQIFNNIGFGHYVEGDKSKTLLRSIKADSSDIVAYCLQGNMIGRKDKNGPQGSGINENVAFTLNTIDHHAITAVFNRQRSDMFREQDLACTQSARQHKDATDLCVICETCIFDADQQVISAVDCRNLCETEELSGTLASKSTGGYSLNYQNPVRKGYIVRRLTPIECERLQGYPDGWTEYGHDGKPLSDTARYQALGNSVAIPCVAYVLSGIADEFYSEINE